LNLTYKILKKFQGLSLRLSCLDNNVLDDVLVGWGLDIAVGGKCRERRWDAAGIYPMLVPLIALGFGVVTMVGGWVPVT
jgi:hypothetical protein